MAQGSSHRRDGGRHQARDGDGAGGNTQPRRGCSGGCSGQFVQRPGCGPEVQAPRGGNAGDAQQSSGGRGGGGSNSSGSSGGGGGGSRKGGSSSGSSGSSGSNGGTGSSSRIQSTFIAARSTAESRRLLARAGSQESVGTGARAPDHVLLLQQQQADSWAPADAPGQQDQARAHPEALSQSRAKQTSTVSRAGAQAGTTPVLTRIGAETAWGVTRGDGSLVVAVLDTGIDLKHPALKQSVWVNRREVPGNGIDDDGNGYVDDVNGYSFLGACTGDLDLFGDCTECGPTNDVSDTDGHGTHVAGIIAAAQNAALGVAGVAPNVKIMVLKVSDCATGAIYAAAVFMALDYALAMGAHLVSCSFGRAYPDHFSPSTYAPPWQDHQVQSAAYLKALAPLRDSGMLVLASAGNSAADLDALSRLGYSNSPCLAGTALRNVLCVAATAEDGDSLAPYSNYGRQAVAIAAPGTVTSTWPGGGARELWGTSMATPLVAGTAALVLSAVSALSGNATGQADTLRSVLLSSPAPVAPGAAPGPAAGAAPPSAASSAGRVDAAAAVQQVLSRFSPPGMPAAAPRLTEAAASGGQVSHASFQERYYASGTPGGWQKGAPSDASARAGKLPLGGFKYGKGFTVRLTSSLLLRNLGIYNVRVSTPGAPQLSVGGSPAPGRTTPGGRLFVFRAKSPGWYEFDIALPDPAGPLDMELRDPDSGSFARPTGWQTFVTGGGGVTGGGVTGGGVTCSMLAGAGSYWSLPSPPVPSFVTSRSSWTFYYNATGPVGAAGGGSAAATPAVPAATKLPVLGRTGPPGLAAYRRAAVARGLSFEPGALRAFLLPQAAPGSGAVGAAVGGVEVAAPGTGRVFKVNCKSCTLSVAGDLIMDSWQSAAAPKGGAPKQSGCVTFRTAGVYTVQVNFGASNADDAPLSLQWAPCGQPDAWSAVPGADSGAWVPGEGLTGWADGMQCDVWKGAVAAARTPAYKTRLQAGARFPNSLDSMLPGLGAAYPATTSQLFSVRCWAFTSADFGTASWELGPKGLRASAFLGHVKVAEAAAASTPTASWRHSDGSVLRPLVLQWEGVAATQHLMVQLGRKPFSLPFQEMRLPLPAVPSPPPAQGGGGAPGHSSAAYTVPLSSPSLDVLGLIMYDVSGLKPQGTYTNKSAGLDVEVRSYSGVTAGSLRYAAAAGYLVSPVTKGRPPALTRLTLRNPPKQGAALVAGGAGGVSICSGAGFAARVSAGVAAESVVCDVFMAPGLLCVAVVLKSQGPGAGASFSAAAALPPAGAAPVSALKWYGAKVQP